MSIFSRLGDILNANITALLDRAEDPEKMIRLVVQEMEDTLVEVRSAAVKAIAERKEIERNLVEIEESQAEWGRKAEFALSHEREDLARDALMARRKLGETADALKHELDAVNDSVAKFDDDLANLQTRLDEARAKQNALSIRMTTAQKRVKLRDALHSGRIETAFARYETVERRIDEIEGKADAYDLGKGRDLEDEFATLEAQTAVEGELNTLKRKLTGDKK